MAARDTLSRHLSPKETSQQWRVNDVVILRVQNPPGKKMDGWECLPFSPSNHTANHQFDILFGIEITPVFDKNNRKSYRPVQIRKNWRPD